MNVLGGDSHMVVHQSYRCAECTFMDVLGGDSPMVVHQSHRFAECTFMDVLGGNSPMVPTNPTSALSEPSKMCWAVTYPWSRSQTSCWTFFTYCW